MRLAALLFCLPLTALEVNRIWDAGAHNAFTDLIHHKGRFLCVFREGDSHVAGFGKIRVIASKDGRTWKSLSLLEQAGADLRDPKITLTPKGELMLTAAMAFPKRDTPGAIRHQTVAYFSRDGGKWSEPHKIGEPNFWLWRVQWFGGRAYSIGYETAADRNGATRLYESTDGRSFRTLVPALHRENYTNESSIQFGGDGTATCLLRRDGELKTALLGTAKPPYTDWEWRDLGARIGGPHFIVLPNGRKIGVVRLHDGSTRTSIVEIGDSIKELTPLPSKGDSSYAGLVWRKGELWISYYSSHQGKTAIYLARWKP